MKTIVIGSINEDLITTTKVHPRDGETIYGDSFSTHLGGKGANQAIAIAKFGSDTSFFGAVGKDSYGENAIKVMKSHNIDTSLILEKDISTGIATIVVNRGGENSIIVVPGANHEITPSDIDNIREKIENMDMVLFQLELPLDVIEHAIKIARSMGKKTILNTAPFMDMSDDIYKNTDLLIMNEVEFSSFAESKNIDEKDAIEKLKSFGIKEIILTKGEKGSELYIGNEKKEFKSYKVSNVVDTTGAGDCFIGALMHKLSNRKPMEEAIDFASKAAAISVTRNGASSSIPDINEVETYSFS